MEDRNQQTVLIVDDIPGNIDVLNGILKSEYKVIVATSGEVALKLATSKNSPDLILLDIMMPKIDGYEICRILKENSKTQKIPVIFVTAKDESTDEARGFEVGAVDYITKPISPPIVRARVRTHLALYDQNRALEETVRQRTTELQETQLEIIQRLGIASEYKDEETGDHIIRVSHYSRIIGESLGMESSESELILHAAPMHDVGKIGIPDRILRKPGKLDKDEWNIMKTHTTIGAHIIGIHNSEIIKTAKVVAATHHERWDGSGYPAGLGGKEIPLISRIVSMADVFDALTSKRPYKSEWPLEKALSEIKQNSGTQFDPEVVDAFLKSIPEILAIKKQYSKVITVPGKEI